MPRERQLPLVFRLDALHEAQEAEDELVRREPRDPSRPWRRSVTWQATQEGIAVSRGWAAGG